MKDTVDAWVLAGGITRGRVFRAINKAGKVWGDGMTPKVIWELVKTAAARADIERLAPHDLRRTCARLCHLAGGELDQIQFLLGHVSIQTTERYLGCKQKLRVAVNDTLGIEPEHLVLGLASPMLPGSQRGQAMQAMLGTKKLNPAAMRAAVDGE